MIAEKLSWLLRGFCLLVAASLAWDLFVKKARLSARLVALHAFGAGLMVLIVAIGGILLPWFLFIFGVFLPVALLIEPTDIVARRGRLYLLHASITLVALIAAIGAPLRAAVTALRLYWDAFPADMLLYFLPLGPRSIAVFDVAVAACGIGLATAGGPWNVGRLWRQTRQVENLPTSKARSAAIGLAEFKGIAREAGPSAPQDVEESGDPHFWRASLSDKILFNGEARGDERVARKRKWSAFYVEDETGRLLVDPRGAEFWDGSGGLFFESIRRIHLPQRIVKESNPFVVSAQLCPGDPVYLVGSVEVNPDAAPGAADSDRLVVRPRPKPSGLLERVLLFEDVVPGGDIHHLFFLSSKAEAEVVSILRRSLHQTVVMVFIWLVASSWLFAARLPAAASTSSSFFAPGVVKWRAERERARLSRLVEKVRAGETTPTEATPVVLEALGRKEPYLKAKAVSALLALLGRTQERPLEAIPLLIELLESGGAGSGFRGREDSLAEASLCLGWYGAAARPAVPALIALLEHRDNLVRYHAVKALGDIGPVDDRMVPALAIALKDVSPGVRNAAAYVLWRMGKAAQGATPALTEALSDTDAQVRELARRALAGLEERGR